MYRTRFTINALPRMANGREPHWAKVSRERKQWHNWVALAIGFNKPSKPLEQCKIECIRFSSREPDYDNLAYSFKAVIDGLKNCGIIADDKSSCVVERKYRWAKAPLRKGSIEVIVEETVNDQ